MNVLWFVLGSVLGIGGAFGVFYLTIGVQIQELKKNLDLKNKEKEEYRSLFDEEKIKRIKAETQLAESLKNVDAQKNLLEDARKKLAETFGSLSQSALASNNKMFMDLAKTTMEKLMGEMKGDLGKKQEAINNIIKPLSETLIKYDEQMRRLEENRQKAYGTLENQIKNMVTVQQNLQKETGNLVNALKTPNVRGRWGEITLKRVVELAGMSEHCDFSEQESIDGPDGKLRPDMVVRLPNNRLIIVDSKTPLQAYIEALSAETEEERLAYMKKHASQVAHHMKQLSKKAYWDQFEQTPEIVVMFIPGESFFSAAVDINKTLIEEGIENKVIIATPTTLIALLRSISYGWRQEKITKNALEIKKIGEELYERINVFLTHYSKMGKSLEQTVDSYNRSVSSFESRVLVSARRFNELGIAPTEPIKEMKQLEKVPRLIESQIE